MGQVTSTKIQYGVYIGEEKKGETRILRNKVIGDGPMREVNSFGVQTIWDALENSINKLGVGNRKCIGYRKRIDIDKFENKYEWLTYNEVKEKAIKFAKGAAKLDLCAKVESSLNGKFKFIGIYSKNRPEWVIADLASHCNCVTVVTIYDTLGLQAVEHILKQTQLTSIVIESVGLKKILALAKEKKISQLKNLILLDNDDPTSENELKECGLTLYNFNDVLKEGEGFNVQFEHAKPETICTICYTSGTTGLPKGAMISHKALLSEINIMDSVDFEMYEDDVYFSFLPLAHIMERLIITLLITHGRPFGFYTGSPARIIEDAGYLKPTLMCGVPRIFQRVYEAIQKKLSKLPYFKKLLVEKAVEQKAKDFKERGILKNCFWDPIVFNEFKNVLGGKVRFMLTGSAPMDPEILCFLKIAFCCPIVEGYGQTEDCAGMLLSNIFDNVPGHIGGPGFANEVKLVDVPELDYFSTDANPETGVPEPRGEICIRGPVLFSGYFEDPENTKKAIDEEGWLHTGDIGIILSQHGNAVKIIDRKKNIFKLSQGEYVAPEKLENVLVRSLYVNQIFVYGDSYKNYLVAIVVPREETCVEFLKTKGIETTKDNVTEFYDDEDLKKAVLKDLETLGKNSDFKGFEIIKKVHLSKEAFTIENDLVTPSLKIKRHVAKKTFKAIIDNLYK